MQPQWLLQRPPFNPSQISMAEIRVTGESGRPSIEDGVIMRPPISTAFEGVSRVRWIVLSNSSACFFFLSVSLWISAQSSDPRDFIGKVLTIGTELSHRPFGNIYSL